MNSDDVRKIASLARLRLTDEEAAKFAEQFDRVLGHLESLRAVDTTGVQPLDHPLPLSDVLQADVPRAGLSRYAVFCSAPDHTKDCFRVPPLRGESDG